MTRVALLSLFLAATAAAQTPKAPPAKGPEVSTLAVAVPGSDAPRPTAGTPIVCPVGRFVPLVPLTADPLTFDVSDPTAVVLDVLPVGTPLYGIKFDEPAGAKAKLYRFPDAKGPVALLLPERDVSVSVWKNGEAGAGPLKVQSVMISVTGPRPPPGPNPPGPTPPVPPTPDGTSPFTEAGFRVLMVFDSTNTVRPAQQNSVLYGKAVRDYLESKCVIGPDGKTKEYRIYPANTDLSADRATWRDAFGKKGGDDWILIGDGRAGYSGPLPKSEAEALELLRKHGGN